MKANYHGMSSSGAAAGPTPQLLRGMQDVSETGRTCPVHGLAAALKNKNLIIIEGVFAKIFRPEGA
jgi:hypothetical protein